MAGLGPGHGKYRGDGRAVTREDHLEAACLWIKGARDGVPFDRRLWFSDTDARTPRGWKHFYGQASLKLPDAPGG